MPLKGSIMALPKGGAHILFAQRSTYAAQREHFGIAQRGPSLNGAFMPLKGSILASSKGGANTRIAQGEPHSKECFIRTA